MWLDSKAVNCPQKWGNFTVLLSTVLLAILPRLCGQFASHP